MTTIEIKKIETIMIDNKYLWLENEGTIIKIKIKALKKDKEIIEMIWKNK